MPIQKLSPSLINKIAAGEVIERPASVVKELMENALDAGATRVDVAAVQGGLDLVRVVDNGGGIAAEDMPLAVAPHATSKLAGEDDLFRVGTLGFRGEALASIAEVSRLVLRSRTPQSPGGMELEVVGGRTGQPAPCGCPPGTNVEVQNLFFNTPVRRKFLRTVQTEFGHVAEAFTRIALAAPHVHFTLKHNGRPVFELAAEDGLRDRIARFFGGDLAQNLFWIESADGPVRLSGYAAHPSQSRSHNRMQYFFLNGRHIRDRSLQHALGEAYRGLLMAGRCPIAFLELAMPPELVDVNVHPTKLEVRFQDSGRLYSQLLSTLRNRFLSTDLNTQFQSGDSPNFRGICPNSRASENGTVPFGAGQTEASGGMDPGRAAQLKEDLVAWAKGQVAAWDVPDGGAAEAVQQSVTGDSASSRIDQPTLLLHTVDHPISPESLPHSPLPLGEGQGVRAAYPLGESLPHSPLPLGEGQGVRAWESGFSSPKYLALQIHNRYLVTETDEGVMVIDQHALHERILYEQLKERIGRGTMETQALLTPEPVDLSPAEAAAALENREVLAALGLKLEPFGGDTLLITGYPAMLANLPPAEMLRLLLEPLLSAGKTPDHQDLLDELLHTIACKAAIKAGDRLAPEEIESLLLQRHLAHDSHHCPHGRPAALIFTREELDRQFKRV
jgi:DNA mismatch repair protein MutL